MLLLSLSLSLSVHDIDFETSYATVIELTLPIDVKG